MPSGEGSVHGKDGSKSVSKALALSAVLPGAGCVYVGRLQDGIASATFFAVAATAFALAPSSFTTRFCVAAIWAATMACAYRDVIVYNRSYYSDPNNCTSTREERD